MITINLSRAFFILMCYYALFSTFRGTFRADCIEQFTTFEREFFRCLLEKIQEPGLTLFRSYPGLEYQTICRCHSLGGSTFSSDILRLREMVQSRAWALDLRCSTTWTNQAAVFESLSTFPYSFYPHHRHWYTRYNSHLGCSYLPQTTQSSFDEIRE